ncbi:unnamed protein product [Clonostachys solani]|uniref:Uncharacterized protein n=1 Tax=Clonostachys solani TaxID=160281 RepID=A0A9N9ZEH9_9HYPO|nr:unnamed protein product [Clonostachys solani]
MVYVGIDAGTTHSCVFVDQECVLIHQKRTFPSMVRITKNGTWSLASPDESEDGDQCVLSLPKLVIGRDKNDGKLEADASVIPHLVHTDYGPQYKVFGRNVSPLEVIAFIMGKIFQAVNRRADTIDRVVVAVPSYFNWGQCDLTRSAAIIAGFDKKTIHIIQEPILSYISLIKQIQEKKECIILDIGGGTTDISIVQTEKGVHCMLATVGNTRLGGAHFDNELVNYTLKMSGKTRKGLTPDNMRRLMNECRHRKMDLSDARTTTISFNGTQQTITRDDAQHIFRPPLEKVRKVMLELHKEWKNAEKAEQILCVGGSIPTIGLNKLCQATFPLAKCIKADAAGEAVALGASLAASNLCTVRNVQPQDIRLLISKKRGNGTCILYKTDQEKVCFSLFEGKFPNFQYNKALGSFWVEGLSELPQETPITVTIKVGEPGEMAIAASIENLAKSLVIQRKAQVTQPDLERLKKLTLARLDGKSDSEFEEEEHGAGDGKDGDSESDADGELDFACGHADSGAEAVDGNNDAGADSDGQKEVTEVTGSHPGSDADSTSGVGAENGVNADSDSQGDGDENDDENDDESDTDADGDEAAEDGQEDADAGSDVDSDVDGETEAVGNADGKNKRKDPSLVHRGRDTKRVRD